MFCPSLIDYKILTFNNIVHLFKLSAYQVFFNLVPAKNIDNIYTFNYLKI